MASPTATEKRVSAICKSQNENRGHNPSTESECILDMPLTTTAADFCRSLSGRPGRDRKGASSNAAPPNFSGELNRKGLLQIGRTMKVIRTVRVRGPDLSSSRVVDCIRKPYAPARCVPVERRRRVFQKSRNRSQRTLAWFTNGGGGHLRTSLLLHGQLTPFASATRRINSSLSLRHVSECRPRSAVPACRSMPA